MKNFFQFLPPQASSIAGKIDTLYLFLIALTLFFTALIFVLVTFFAVRYRRRHASDRPKPIHGNLFLEIFWTAIPSVLALFIFVWGVWILLLNNQVPANAMEIFVVGKQWMWKIQHAEGPREINELHIPVNRPIKLLMTSEDVIHSFYIPAFRIKMDTVPGKYTKAWFEATKPGKYHLFCAEYCGTKHSQMIGWVTVLTEQDYEQWLAERMDQVAPVSEALVASTAQPLEVQGKALFESMRCITCHGETKTALGPSLRGLYNQPVLLSDNTTLIADENYLRESILEPQKKQVAGFGPFMPTFTTQLNEEKILALISYIKSLSIQTLPASPVPEAGSITSVETAHPASAQEEPIHPQAVTENSGMSQTETGGSSHV